MTRRKAEYKTLGMEEGITRRDFLNSTLIASGAALLSSAAPREVFGEPADDDWTGYGGVGDYANSNGNTKAVVGAGHQIRDNAFMSLPPDTIETGETYDCVIVGGGISGLAAALLFQQKTAGKLKSLVLDNHPIFGGEAKRNEFIVDGQRLAAHQGSAMFWAPFPYSFLGRFYDSIGLRPPELTYQKWSGTDPEFALPLSPYDVADPKHYGYFYPKSGTNPGTWVIDPWAKKLAGAPIPAKAKSELLAMWAAESKDQRPKYPGDAISRHLDSISIEQHLMETYGLSRDTIRAYLSDEGSGSGLGPDALSAYADYAADFLYPMDPGGQMFPGGNTGIARLITKTLIPDAIDSPPTLEGVARGAVKFDALDRAKQNTRVRLNATAVWVQHEGDAAKSDHVMVAYTRESKMYRVKARSAIMAGGCWTSKHIVRDLPAEHRDAYAQFYRSPCLMANVAVRNWRFLYKMGIVGCRWFGGGLGNYTTVRKMATCGPQPATINPESPTVLTIKHIYSYPGMSTQQQGIRGRFEMLGTSYSDYERQIREQFTDMFAPGGFDAKRDIAGIVLNRWGHAYLSPQPGFFFGKDGKPAPSDVLRAAPFGRIAFANTDLAGIMDHRCSILEANRAVEQLCEQVLRA